MNLRLCGDLDVNGAGERPLDLGRPDGVVLDGRGYAEGAEGAL